ncbi:rRNA-processing Fcf1-like protein [Gregarina niphandrodes]|uniref:rRNA-processing Fcf1-like protein n=1 Tax=Gregarina niphandrodes TaxID=110365 RepID=A0A023B5R4_GRENI|nr:rRNA-processing Fcf1-like protein [Gregarina niphandrodes]EZG61985.1 rRNA-processing Fcf1-like protein [Gregarina niphandrodes]|eukprot:XP_011130738.1 rRNA-processing Fcf1-like protein [Gregarina niphandrodes]
MARGGLKILKPTDQRVKKSGVKKKQGEKRETEAKKHGDKDGGETRGEERVIEREEWNSALFFTYNTQLGPPYQVLMDTNFINFSIQHKIDPFKGLMDLLFAKVVPVVTDCIVGELEKMGQKFRLALRIAKDPRVKRLTCDHPGTYADDCIIKRISNHRCYIVGTSDKELKRRIRKVPGVPIVSVTQHKYAIERLPEATQK